MGNCCEPRKSSKKVDSRREREKQKTKTKTKTKTMKRRKHESETSDDDSVKPKDLSVTPLANLSRAPESESSTSSSTSTSSTEPTTSIRPIQSSKPSISSSTGPDGTSSTKKIKPPLKSIQLGSKKSAMQMRHEKPMSNADGEVSHHTRQVQELKAHLEKNTQQIKTLDKQISSLERQTRALSQQVASPPKGPIPPPHTHSPQKMSPNILRKMSQNKSPKKSKSKSNLSSMKGSEIGSSIASSNVSDIISMTSENDNEKENRKSKGQKSKRKRSPTGEKSYTDSYHIDYAHQSEDTNKTGKAYLSSSKLTGAHAPKSVLQSETSLSSSQVEPVSVSEKTTTTTTATKQQKDAEPKAKGGSGFALPLHAGKLTTLPVPSKKSKTGETTTAAAIKTPIGLPVLHKKSTGLPEAHKTSTSLPEQRKTETKSTVLPIPSSKPESIEGTMSFSLPQKEETKKTDSTKMHPVKRFNSETSKVPGKITIPPSGLPSLSKVTISATPAKQGEPSQTLLPPTQPPQAAAPTATDNHPKELKVDEVANIPLDPNIKTNSSEKMGEKGPAIRTAPLPAFMKFNHQRPALVARHLSETSKMKERTTIDATDPMIKSKSLSSTERSGSSRSGRANAKKAMSMLKVPRTVSVRSALKKTE